MFWNIVLFLLIALFSYEIVRTMYERKIFEKVNEYINEKNEEYYDAFLKRYEKSKKVKLVDRLNIIYKINLLIDRANLQRSVFINPITLLITGIICLIFAYIIVFNYLKIITLSFIVSLPFSLIPFIALNFIGTYKEEKLEKVFLNFLLQIKNYTKINNDIMSAFKEIETIEPLQSYIKRFNLEISSGIKFEIAIEHLKEKVTINKFKQFFANVQYCYLYGGNFSELIDKNYRMISDIQKEKSKRLQETKGARLVLIILIILNLFMYFTYIENNYDNYIIMQKSFFGMFILYWNFISMWLLLLLASKVKKLDY